MVISEKIISKHNIKPSSPTPNRLRNHKLSFLDQIQPLYNVPCVFLYQNDDETKPKPQQAVISQLVRQSLSEILSVFYPLAGTLKENSMIYCDDSGVELVEAQVHGRLAEFAEIEDDLKQLVPVEGSDKKHRFLLVKLSFFECGGIALGVEFSHKIMDFASFAMFMNAWAATCRGELANVTQPTFDLEPYFPQKDCNPPMYTPQDPAEKIVQKRLVFDKEKIERLKNEVELKNPTSVEAVTGFLWKQIIEATKVNVPDTEKMSFLVGQAMNLRGRLVPEHSFGNCSNPATVIVAGTTSSSDLISKLRVAIKAAAVDIKEMIDEVKNEKEKVGGIIGFSSLRRIPVYDVDFGWGKPVRVCVTTVPFLNSVVLMSTPSGDGFEALLANTQDVLLILQTNYNRIFKTSSTRV